MPQIFIGHKWGTALQGAERERAGLRYKRVREAHFCCWQTMFVPKPCVCGGAISFHHVLFNCRECSAHFAPVTSSLTRLDSHCASEAWRCGTSRTGACSVPQPNSSTAARWQPTCKCAGRPRTSLAPPVPGLTPGDGGSPHLHNVQSYYVFNLSLPQSIGAEPRPPTVRACPRT